MKEQLTLKETKTLIRIKITKNEIAINVKLVNNCNFSIIKLNYYKFKFLHNS